MGLGLRPRPALFQSHAGSIEASQAMLKCLQRLSFNPTLVRLRRHRRPLDRRHLPQFQSHAGSIEAITTRRGIDFVLTRFNPTLVRLRRCNFVVDQKLKLEQFQSHAGSIEAGPNGEETRSEPDRFNPTLVRLRLVKPRLVGVPVSAVSIPRWFD